MGARKVQVLSSNGVVCQHLLWGACWQNLGLVKLWLGCQGHPCGCWASLLLSELVGNGHGRTSPRRCPHPWPAALLGLWGFSAFVVVLPHFLVN